MSKKTKQWLIIVVLLLLILSTGMIIPLFLDQKFLSDDIEPNLESDGSQEDVNPSHHYSRSTIEILTRFDEIDRGKNSFNHRMTCTAPAFDPKTILETSLVTRYGPSNICAPSLCDSERHDALSIRLAKSFNILLKKRYDNVRACMAVWVIPRISNFFIDFPQCDSRGGYYIQEKKIIVINELVFFNPETILYVIEHELYHAFNAFFNQIFYDVSEPYPAIDERDKMRFKEEKRKFQLFLKDYFDLLTKDELSELDKETLEKIGKILSLPSPKVHYTEIVPKQSIQDLELSENTRRPKGVLFGQRWLNLESVVVPEKNAFIPGGILSKIAGDLNYCLVVRDVDVYGSEILSVWFLSQEEYFRQYISKEQVDLLNDVLKILEQDKFAEVENIIKGLSVKLVDDVDVELEQLMSRSQPITCQVNPDWLVYNIDRLNQLQVMFLEDYGIGEISKSSIDMNPCAFFYDGNKDTNNLVKNNQDLEDVKSHIMEL